MRVALLVLLLLSACVRPQISVCGQPGSCVLNTCTADNACNAKPVEIKGGLP